MVWTGFTVVLVLCAFGFGTLFGIGIMGWGFRIICQRNGEVTVNKVRYMIIPEKELNAVVAEKMKEFLRRRFIEHKAMRKRENEQRH